MPTLEKLGEQILEQLELLHTNLHTLIEGRPPIFSVEQLSSTKPYIIDYKERKHLYIWLPSPHLRSPLKTMALVPSRHKYGRISAYLKGYEYLPRRKPAAPLHCMSSVLMRW